MLIKAKQSTKVMLCENKLTNLVFKNQEKQFKTQLSSVFFLLFYFIFLKNKQKQPRMKCMNDMQCKSQKQRKQKPKNNGHKQQSNEAQGPCQKDSI